MNSGDLPPQQPKKSKFKPTQQTRRIKVPKRQADVNDERAGFEILQRLRESKNRKVEVAKGSSSSSPSNSNQARVTAKSYETITAVESGNINNYASSSRDDNQRTPIISSRSDEALTNKVEKNYIEPWDLDGNYPTTLPLRRPFAGDPKTLDILEFGENQSTEPNESWTSHATELGLCEYHEEPKFFMVQLPPKFPIPKQFFVPPSNTNTAPGPARVPGGQIAKMLVYKSGKVKWKVGETIFDAAPGLHSKYMAQDLVEIDTKEKKWCEIGKVEKKMTITPDLDFLLDSCLDLI